MRAAHCRLDPAPLIDDDWGDRLVGEAQRETLRREVLSRLAAADVAQARDAPDTFLFEALRQSPAYANVVLRTRYTEDALAEAVVRGTRQYVLIGAGFDSFALRRPAWAQGLAIFEIDHPATQRYKLERLAQLGVKPGAGVHFIAADLAEESVAQALTRSTYDRRQRSFFSWLGVTMYLTREANLATLDAIAHCAPSGSRLSFTYLESRTLAEPSARFQAIQARVTAFGEPFLSGFDPQQLAADLQAFGLVLIDDVTGADAAARYGRRQFARPGTSHLALAQVR